MTSQAVDIFSMLNKAQNEYNQQQNSVAAFFQQASNGGVHNASNRSVPLPIQSLSSLEQIERQIRTSPPSHQDSQNNNNVLQTSQSHNAGNSPLAQFLNSSNFNNAAPRAAPAVEVKAPREKLNGQKISAPPGFNTKVQPQKNLLSSKETKLITPTMFAPSSNNNSEKKVTAPEPLTKNQLVQALNYLIENDEEFMRKIHEAYIKSFKNMAS